MVKECVVGGCSNRANKDVSLHRFPLNKALRKQWTKAVQTTRKNWDGPNPTRNDVSLVCSEHFTEDCIDPSYKIKKSFGLKVQKSLVQGAVPTIFRQDQREKQEKTVVRGAYEKRERSRIVQEAIEELNIKALPEIMDEMTESIDIDNVVDIMPDMPVKTESISTQVSPVMVNASFQVNIKPLKKSKRTQINLKPLKDKAIDSLIVESKKITFRSKATQCDLLKASTPNVISSEVFPEPISMSTPKKRRLKEEYTMNNQSFSSLPSERLKESLDVSYEPAEEVFSDFDSSFSDSGATDDIPHQRKYLVFESCLLALFTTCLSCYSTTTASISMVKGTFVSVCQECSCGFVRKWNSQPFVGNIPAGNILLSSGILYTGLLPSKIIRFFKNMNIACITTGTFFQHQKAFLFPAVESLWKGIVNSLLNRIVTNGGSVVLAGDGRADSPGHCAKYGLYTLMDVESGNIITMELVQSNEVKSSGAMEKEGLIRAIDVLKSYNISISLIITDRHVQIQKWLRENLPSTRHCYDVWHVAKSLKKKLTAISNEKLCQDVRPWIKSLTNHLYWCAASSPDGDGEMIVSKWKSVANHIQNIHQGHDGVFASCEHGGLDKRGWLIPGTRSCSKVEEVVLKTRFCRDVKKLSQNFQTSGLEAFHSVLNQFAPKMFSFSFHGMQSRQILAALHYNENANRETAVKEDKLCFPKFKKGDYSVREIKTDSTYHYVEKLMEKTFSMCEIGMSQFVTTTSPPPLTASINKPDKEEAISMKTSRFKSN